MGEEFRKQILQVWCDTLHCHVTGSSDPMPDEEAAAIADYIKQRVGKWTDDTATPWGLYDNAVKHLCLMTLLEYDRRLPVCPVCHGARATQADTLRALDPELSDVEQPWELALCWVAHDGPHSRAVAGVGRILWAREANEVSEPKAPPTSQKSES